MSILAYCTVPGSQRPISLDLSGWTLARMPECVGWRLPPWVQRRKLARWRCWWRSQCGRRVCWTLCLPTRRRIRCRRRWMPSWSRVMRYGESRQRRCWKWKRRAMSKPQKGFQAAYRTRRMREVGMRDPHTRCRRSIMVSRGTSRWNDLGKITFFSNDRQLRSEASRQNR